MPALARNSAAAGPSALQAAGNAQSSAEQPVVPIADEATSPSAPSAKKNKKLATISKTRQFFGFKREKPAPEPFSSLVAASPPPPVGVTCKHCGVTGDHYTKDCEAEECDHCGRRGHTKGECEAACPACSGRGRIKIEPVLNDHPDPTVRIMTAMIAGWNETTEIVSQRMAERLAAAPAVEDMSDADRAAHEARVARKERHDDNARLAPYYAALVLKDNHAFFTDLDRPASPKPAAEPPVEAAVEPLIESTE